MPNLAERAIRPNNKFESTRSRPIRQRQDNPPTFIPLRPVHASPKPHLPLGNPPQQHPPNIRPIHLRRIAPLSKLKQILKLSIRNDMPRRLPPSTVFLQVLERADLLEDFLAAADV
jgi:hypothetical protein